MPQNLLAIHGVIGLVVCVGEGGKILMFRGDIYSPIETVSPTTGTLRGVAVVSPTEAWAVGDEGIFHFDGHAWHNAAPGAKYEGFTCVWAHPDAGVWFAGRRSLMNWPRPGESQGGLLVHSETPFRAVWGTGPKDVWFLAQGGILLHWNGTGCDAERLSGDVLEEWSAVCGGGPDDPVYVVGPSGFALEYSRETGRWWEISTDTALVLTGACSDGADSLYVTTETGLLRHYDGRRWRTVAFSSPWPRWAGSREGLARGPGGLPIRLPEYDCDSGQPRSGLDI